MRDRDGSDGGARVRDVDQAKQAPDQPRTVRTLKEYHIANLRSRGLLRGGRSYPEFVLTSHSAGGGTLVGLLS